MHKYLQNFLPARCQQDARKPVGIARNQMEVKSQTKGSYLTSDFTEKIDALCKIRENNRA
jgi:hypothetical protein